MAAMQTPEERLCSRSWRLKNSAWLLWSIVSAGLLTGVGFLIHAIAMKSKKMYLIAGAWILAGVIYVVLSSFIDTGTKENPVDTPEAKFLGGYITALFFGGVTHSALTNRSWLRWKAHNSGNGTPWYAGSNGDPSSNANTQNDSTAKAFSGVGIGSSFSGGSPVDVNTASIDELVGQGFDAVSASKIVSEKKKTGPFRDQDDLLQRSGVAPHIVLAAGNELTYGTDQNSQNSNSPENNNGSTSNRRKLDF